MDFSTSFRIPPMHNRAEASNVLNAAFDNPVEFGGAKAISEIVAIALPLLYDEAEKYIALQGETKVYDEPSENMRALFNRYILARHFMPHNKNTLSIFAINWHGVVAKEDASLENVFGAVNKEPIGHSLDRIPVIVHPNKTFSLNMEDLQTYYLDLCMSHINHSEYTKVLGKRKNLKTPFSLAKLLAPNELLYGKFRGANGMSLYHALTSGGSFNVFDDRNHHDWHIRREGDMVYVENSGNRVIAEQKVRNNTLHVQRAKRLSS